MIERNPDRIFWLYLYHVLHYVRKYCYDLTPEIEPDEWFLRSLEALANIKEAECADWRHCVFSHMTDGRIDEAWSRLQAPIEQLRMTSEMIHFLRGMPNIIPGMYGRFHRIEA